MIPRRKALLATLHDPAPAVQAAAAQALDRLDLAEQLASGERTRSLGRLAWIELLRSMAGLRDELGLKIALRALSHPDQEVRLAALDAVETWSDPRASAAVAGRLTDPSPLVRARAAEVLGALGDRRGGHALLALLTDRDPGTVASAAQSLGQLGHGAGEQLLIELLQHPKAEVRAAAAEALGRIGVSGPPTAG